MILKTSLLPFSRTTTSQTSGLVERFSPLNKLWPSQFALAIHPGLIHAPCQAWDRGVCHEGYENGKLKYFFLYAVHFSELESLFLGHALLDIF